MIDIKSSLDNPAIFRKYIDFKQLLHWDIMSKDDKERYQNEKFSFYSNKIELTDKFTIIAYSDYSFLDSKIEFTLDDIECTFEGSD
jgi:hypothetical protein